MLYVCSDSANEIDYRCIANMAQVETDQLHPGDQHEIPSFEAHESSDSLKGRIKKHYEIASDYYYSLW